MMTTEAEDVEQIRLLSKKIDPLLPAEDIAAKWRQFCEIQAATWLCVTDEEVKRFDLWCETGNDEDAWS